MKARLGGRIKADTLSLALSAFLLIAALWLVVDQLARVNNLLASLLCFLALGLFLGDQLRIVAAQRKP